MRDARIVASLERPRTTQQIHDEVADVIPRYDSLCRRLRRLRKKGRVRHQGTVQLRDVGRPMDYYCNAFTVKKDNALHEILMTDVNDMVLGRWMRGHNLDKEIRPDAVLIRAGEVFYAELDTGEQSGRQLAAKFGNYVAAKFPHKVLFVTCGGMERLKNVVKHVPPGLEARVLLTTYHLVMGSESDAIWYGVSLKKAVALPL